MGISLHRPGRSPARTSPRVFLSLNSDKSNLITGGRAVRRRPGTSGTRRQESNRYPVVVYDSPDDLLHARSDLTQIRANLTALLKRLHRSSFTVSGTTSTLPT
ncbi:hypothetical protein [Streptomyces sp. NPDC054834]